MPHIEGQSLRDKLAKEGELPIAEAVRILRDVVDALSEAHDHGVVHRDIKPDNILLTKHHALVTDFGVAKAVSEATGAHQLTTEGVALGTPAYMSPEQAAADKHIDHRADDSVPRHHSSDDSLGTHDGHTGARYEVPGVGASCT